MENDLPCPKCGNDFQTGPSWNEDESIIWWDCECGLSGPDAQTQREAIRLWNDMVRKMRTNGSGERRVSAQRVKMATNAMSLRRIVRATRLTAELGHADILDALKHAEEMRSALRVIHTWAGMPGALDARHVRDLTAKALHMGSNEQN